jgi:trimethylamine--corrinoid protein Co-methyltransferase
LWRGTEEAIHVIGPRNHFLKSKHTRAHMREVWQPTVIDRAPWDERVRQDGPSAHDHARQRARHILATHQPDPLPCADRIREVIAAFVKM